jgi:hypothetical protein
VPVHARSQNDGDESDCGNYRKPRLYERKEPLHKKEFPNRKRIAAIMPSL